jgi:hypothetical protein
MSTLASARGMSQDNILVARLSNVNIGVGQRLKPASNILANAKVIA